MFVVERIEMIIIVKKCSFKQCYEKFYIQFFTERDGLNSYILLQIKERDVLLEMCNEILFFKT